MNFGLSQHHVCTCGSSGHRIFSLLWPKQNMHTTLQLRGDQIHVNVKPCANQFSSEVSNVYCLKFQPNHVHFYEVRCS